VCAFKVSDDKTGNKSPCGVRNPQDIGEYLTGLAEIMENAPMPLAICYKDGYLLNCNGAFCELTGYKKDELYKMADLDALTPLCYQENDSIAREALDATGQLQRNEKEIIRQDGTRAVVEVFYHCTRDVSGNPNFYYFFMNDLSKSICLKEENKRLVKELDRERLRSETLAGKSDHQAKEIDVILNSLTEAVTIYDINCITLRANNAAIACYGFDPSGMDIATLNRKIFFRYPDERRVSPEESPQLLAVLGEKVPAGRFVLTDVKGRDIMVLLSATALYSGGRISGAICTWHDVTEHERLLKRIDKDSNLLHESIMQTELYFDLMSHDMININQVGIGYLELAIEAMKPDDEIGELLQKAYGSFKSSSNLIDNLCKIKRSRSADIRTEAIDLGKLLADIRGRFLEAGGREITINYTPPDNHFVVANNLLEDVFSNILGNSVKHSAGPLSIDMSLIRVFENGRAYYKVSIEDNGPGIPDELKSKIFVRFQRNMTRARSKGIGLYLVKSLMEGFDGRVWVEDRVQGDYSKGCRFVIMLPAIKC